MNGSRRVHRLGGWLALLLVVTGCGAETNRDPSGERSGELRVHIGEPRFLLPTNVSEANVGMILRALFSGLVDYDPKTLAPVNVLAESITTTDQRVWTIRLRPSWTFDNGEPVDAEAFIRAWNYAAYGPNAQYGAHFLDRIQGFAEVQGVNPKATRLSGLHALDDLTIQVTLAEPFSSFVSLLGAPVLLPMARACAADPKACNEAPIGNGPFKMDGRWQHNKRVSLVRNDSYPGARPAIDRLSFVIYAQNETAYNDLLAGQLDFIKDVPPAKVPDARARLGDRLIEQDSPALRYLGFPTYRAPFADKRVRQAISLAINRRAISEAVVNGRYAAAQGFAPAMIPGATQGSCSHCMLNVQRARQLLAEAGGWTGGPLQLWFAAGSGAELLMQAVGDQLRTNLGIDYELRNSLQPAQYQSELQSRNVTGPWRFNWVPDYPLLENYLKPLFGTGAPSNLSGWSNREFDALISAGDRAPTQLEAFAHYGQAERILAEELPLIPLWFDRAAMAYGERVENLTVHPLTRTIDVVNARLRG